MGSGFGHAIPPTLTCCSVSTATKQFRASDHCEIAESSLGPSWHRLMPIMSSGSNESIKIQDYFIISAEKLKHDWTLTTSQYTITHILYFKTQGTVIWKYKSKRILVLSACFGTNLPAQIFAFSLAGTSAVTEINSDCMLQVLLPLLFVSAMSKALLLLCVHQNLAYSVLLLSIRKSSIWSFLQNLTVEMYMQSIVSEWPS